MPVISELVVKVPELCNPRGKKQQIMIVTLHSRGTDKYFSTSINAYFVEIGGYIRCVLTQYASACLHNGDSPSNI